MRKGVAMFLTIFIRNIFIATGERARLKRAERNFIDILNRKINDRPNLMIIHLIHDGCNENYINPRIRKIGNCSKFYIEKIGYFSMLICFVINTVKLQISKS